MIVAYFNSMSHYYVTHLTQFRLLNLVEANDYCSYHNLLLRNPFCYFYMVRLRIASFDFCVTLKRRRHVNVVSKVHFPFFLVSYFPF